MKYKTDKIKRDYNDIGKYPSVENGILRWFIEALELISIMLGFGELTITSYIRDVKKYPKSLHPYGRALDFRVRDKPTIWYWGMCLIGMAIGLMNRRFRMNPHHELYGKDEQHIHIEIRDKK